MSMDPNKWVPFDKLSPETRGRVETLYPYLKLEQCMFQDKHSGVFMKQINSVKIEKLLDPENMPGKQAAPPTPPPPTPTRGRPRKLQQ